MQLEEINSAWDIFSIRLKRLRNIIIWILKFFYNQFNFKILFMQITFFIFFCIGVQEGYSWNYIQQIDILLNYTKHIINFSLGFIALLWFIRLIIWAYQYFYNMIKNNWDVNLFFLKEKAYYILWISGLIQVAISWFIVKAGFNLIWYLNFNIIKSVSRESNISFFLLFITVWHWFINILLWFFSINSKSYRTNYLLWPIILILIFIIYLNYLA